MSGQLSVWITYFDNGGDDARTGARYIPELMLEHSLTDEKSIDASIAVNAYTEAPLPSLNEFDENAQLKSYRMWLRYSSPLFEARAGRQKINFGPAKILRSLKWFDHLDPQDPLELTDGVDALLVRYYFMDNSNLWLWGIKAGDDLKGLEQYTTDNDELEYGGRYQFRVPGGEVALAYNRRRIDAADWSGTNCEPLSDGTEERFALDGNWDVGIGLWFEASAERLKIDTDKDSWRNLITLGADYTFETGVYLLCEHFIESNGSKICYTDETTEISALSVGYNVGIIDSVKGIAYYDSKAGKAYYYFDWQRTYDDIALNFSLFENEQSGDLSGNGIQFMITYNH